MKKLNEYIKEEHKFLVKSSPKYTPIEYAYHPQSVGELLAVIRQHERDGNPNLNDIDVSAMRDLSSLFEYCIGDFIENLDISRWDVSNVIDMTDMFSNSEFNGDISEWDVSNVRNMDGMFRRSPFNKDISNWDVHNVKNMDEMFVGCPLQYNPPKWYKEK